jgi:hypothetical protein
MSVHVSGDNVGEAWLASLEALSHCHWDAINLTVTINDPTTEDLGIRRALEAELARRLRGNAQPAPQSVHTVANTIFPLSLYVPGRNDSAARFFDAAIAGQRSRHGSSARWGTYIGRLVDYPGPKGKANQLELLLAQLRAGGSQWKDRYELAVTIPDRDGPADPDDQWSEPATAFTRTKTTRQRASAPADADEVRSGTHDLRVISDPRSDHHARGGPCLSHISLTMIDSHLHMTALYRRQSYISRAYGNVLGLARLLHFLATESDHQVGELMIVASHAEADGAGCAAVLASATSAQRDVHPIEVQSRVLGASWRDLELPEVS